MLRQPVQFHFTNIQQPAPIEVAARRRMRGMEGAYPAVLEWNLSVEALEPADTHGRFAATTRARIVGGDMLTGHAHASDPLGALRLAFNRLETELDSEHDDARSKAVEWLNAMKRRIAHRDRVEYE